MSYFTIFLDMTILLSHILFTNLIVNTQLKQYRIIGHNIKRCDYAANK